MFPPQEERYDTTRDENSHNTHQYFHRLIYILESLTQHLNNNTLNIDIIRHTLSTPPITHVTLGLIYEYRI